MSVPKCRRHNSKIQFLDDATRFCVYMADLVDRMPRALVRAYGDGLIEKSRSAFSHLKIGNDVRIVDEESYKRRATHFQDALDLYFDISIDLDILFDRMNKKLDRMIDNAFEYLQTQERRITKLIKNCDRSYRNVCNRQQKVSEDHE